MESGQIDRQEHLVRGFIQRHKKDGGKMKMDEHIYCQDIQRFVHESVKRGVDKHMKNQAHTNGTYNNMGMKHFLENVLEFVSLLNPRPSDIKNQMHLTVNNRSGQGLRYKELVA